MSSNYGLSLLSRRPDARLPFSDAWHSTIPIRLRCAELILTSYLVIGFQNSKTSFGALAQPSVKMLLASGSLMLLFVSTPGHQHRALSDTFPKNSIIAVTAYLMSVLGPTAFYGASPDVVFVFMLATIGGLMLVYAEWLRKGTALRVIRAVVIIEVGLAFASWPGPPARADGGSHAITIGLASGTLLFLAGSRWRPSKPDLLVRAALMLLGAVGLYAAFSRSAIIPTIIAMVFWGAIRPGIFRPIRILLLATISITSASRVWHILVDTLSRGDVQGFYSGSGRSAIWTRVWGLRDLYVTHGVGLSNIDGSNHAGEVLLRASLNLPTENSPLQAMISGGLIGAVAWSAILISCLIAIMRTEWSLLTRIGLFSLMAGGCVFSAGFAGSGLGWTILLGVLASATGAKTIHGRRYDRSEHQSSHICSLVKRLNLAKHSS